MTPVPAPSVFVEVRFWLLVALSAVLPAAIYAALLVRRAISRTTVVLFGLVLVLIAGLDVYLLQGLAKLARITPSLADDAVFLSELSIALCILPVISGRFGVNLVSNFLLRHLCKADGRLDR